MCGNAWLSLLSLGLPFLQLTPGVSGSLPACAANVQGSLSTVSTYINEIDGFHKTPPPGKAWAGYRYALGSEGLTQLLLFAMNGWHHLSSSRI